jgi:hypothetical protein
MIQDTAKRRLSLRFADPRVAHTVKLAKKYEAKTRKA